MNVPNHVVHQVVPLQKDGIIAIFAKKKVGDILVVDDEVKLRELLCRILRMEGFSVTEASDCRSALLAAQKQAFDVVLCDVKLPDGNGVEMVPKFRQNERRTEVIVMTAYGNIPDGVAAIKNGAFDYILKGDDNNKIIPLLHRAIEKNKLQERVETLESKLGEKHSFEAIIGTTKALRAAIDFARQVAPTDTTVLLTGETGTGKEVFANAIHQNSPRKSGSFVAINCSAFSQDLLESELFGHLAGAFTGATREKKGLFEEADKGTLFLDEIGELPLNLQAKLLRVLESGEFLKVGSVKPVKVDVRLIAATHRDLLQEITEGRFREDLYYRLSTFGISLPPLRERSKDIEALALFFLAKFAAKANKKITRITPEALQALKLHQWPGNIRELRNVVERSIILERTDALTIDSLPFELQSHLAGSLTESGTSLSAFSLASAEKLHIQKVLNYSGGNKAQTARLLNIGVATLYRKMDEYGLK